MVGVQGGVDDVDKDKLGRCVYKDSIWKSGICTSVEMCRYLFRKGRRVGVGGSDKKTCCKWKGKISGMQ